MDRYRVKAAVRASVGKLEVNVFDPTVVPEILAEPFSTPQIRHIHHSRVVLAQDFFDPGVVGKLRMCRRWIAM